MFKKLSPSSITGKSLEEEEKYLESAFEDQLEPHGLHRYQGEG